MQEHRESVLAKLYFIEDKVRLSAPGDAQLQLQILSPAEQQREQLEILQDGVSAHTLRLICHLGSVFEMIANVARGSPHHTVKPVQVCLMLR